MSRAILFGAVAAVGSGILLSGFLRLLIEVIPLTFLVGNLIAAAGTVGIGYVVGEAVSVGSGRKLDKRLKYVASALLFAGWLAAVSSMAAFDGPVSLLGSPIGIGGLIVAFYIAMSRVKF